MIEFNPEDHSYRDGERRFISVTKLISTVIRKDIDGVDPAVLANAAERGIRTEAYATEILSTGSTTIAAGERQDVVDRVECFYRWYEQEKPELIAAQQVVSDEGNGIAGQLDYLLRFGHAFVGLVDMKCTANPEASWRLQVGAYSSMTRNTHDKCGVLHVNPKYAKGWIWREYDPLIVRHQWASAVQWWKVLGSLKAEA